MIELVRAFLMAVLMAVSAGEPAPEAQPLPPLPVTQVVPDEVIPYEPETVVYDDGTVVAPDGSTSCVTASPCAYAADGREWGEPVMDIDPVWAELEEQS